MLDYLFDLSPFWAKYKQSILVGLISPFVWGVVFLFAACGFVAGLLLVDVAKKKVLIVFGCGNF